MKESLKKIYYKLQQYAGFSMYAGVLLIIMFAAYDLLVWGMGFNYDDWEGIFLHQQGFSAWHIWEYFLIDRPFSSLVHFLFHPILGTSVVGWHLLVLFLHWAAILLLVKSILELFPEYILAAGWIGILLGLFPGISRHFVARTSTPHYVSLFLFALSLWLMIQAVKNRKIHRGFFALSIILALLQSLIIEYFASMEIARFFILLVLVVRIYPNGWANKIKRTVALWLPYLGVFLIFLYFKFSVLPDLAKNQGLDSKHGVPLFASLFAEPAQAIITYANLIIQDVVYVSFYVWASLLNPKEIDLESRALWVSWILGFVFAGLVAAVILAWARQKTPPADLSPRFGIIVFGLSLAILLLGGLPAWFIGRQGLVGLWSSRFFLAQVLGAVPVFVILVLAMTGLARQHIANLILAFFVALSFASQFREANKYTLYWDYQREYYWQLKWRAPSLVDNTFILSPYTPLLMNSDYQIAYAINIIYAPGHAETNSKYWWFDGPDTLRNFDTKEYHPEKEVQATMRNISFESAMTSALPVIVRYSRGCMQVISDDYYQGEPLLSFEEEQMFALANKSPILRDGPPMPENIFGPEPEHGWCYYYQKTELARQFDDWQEIETIWDTVNQKNLTPSYGPEYLPFIDLLARQNDWKEAEKLTIKASKITRDARPFLCSFWQNRLSSYSSFEDNKTHWAAIREEMDCK